MDYKDLANLIFPDAKEISYYEEKYPERNLPEGAVVTRFAPSPTGFVHIGGLYQALVARTVAEKTGGVFFLRVEDTDQKREVENGVTGIVNSLKDFDMAPDEGTISDTEEIGNYGPYKQSLRKEIYQAYAKYLLEQGKAYPCFCTPDDLEEIRNKQEAAKLRTGYYGVWAKCRNLSVEEMAEKVKAGEPYIIRFKSPGREDRKIKHKDVIKGNVDFPENDQDIIIIKSDGLPTYHFAHAVDDHLMHTTHVIRSDEWLSSVPLHLQLFHELGFKAPKYAHISPIMKNDNGGKRKLSKRKDPEAAVSYYKEQGIPTDAVKEYLLNIANSTFENWRRANSDKKIEEFDFQLNKMSVSGALFDMIKLLDIGKTVISKMTAEDVYEKSLKWAEEYDNELADLLKDKEYALKIFGIERGNKKPRKDIAKWSDVKENISYMYDSEFYKNTQEYPYQPAISNKEDISKILDLYIEKYYDENDDKQTWFDKIKEVAGKMGYAKEVKEFKANPGMYKAHVGDVSTVLRVALTSRTNTPDMYEIMQVLGKDRIAKRFEVAKTNLK
ncbi:glutamate--tRNA ligase [Clostridium sp. CAG:356]|nr:glutamate--tRNA ligase [Clostridium sp. CAG:356]